MEKIKKGKDNGNRQNRQKMTKTFHIINIDHKYNFYQGTK